MGAIDPTSHAYIASKVGAKHGPTELVWSIDSVPDDLAAAYRQALINWVLLDYNASFATRRAHVIPPCWPIHLGLAREIAAMWSHWQKIFHGDLGAVDATAFYERTLPGFQSRIDGWLGKDPTACRSAQHPGDWNEQAALIGTTVNSEQQTLTAFEKAWTHFATLSAPPPAPAADEGTVMEFPID
ncbi:MAG: hypothetical protein ACK5MR_18815 [Cumulibacter sp.]